MTAPVHLLAATVSCLLLLTGCGSSSTPAQEVPELADTLTSVEEALAQERYVKARRDLRRLVATTEDARAAGDLGEAEADRVLAAAARLLAALPAVSPQTPTGPDSEPVPSPEPEDSDQAGEGGSGEDGEEVDEDAKELEEERKKLEEERKKLEEERKKQQDGDGDEGKGNGDGSEKGPDDGHGS